MERARPLRRGWPGSDQCRPSLRSPGGGSPSGLQKRWPGGLSPRHKAVRRPRPWRFEGKGSDHRLLRDRRRHRDDYRRVRLCAERSPQAGQAVIDTLRSTFFHSLIRLIRVFHHPILRRFPSPRGSIPELVTLSEAKGLILPRSRFFAEFILSDRPRFFAALRMTGSEGLRMTACSMHLY